MTARLTRSSAEVGAAAPIGVVHIGLGAFHRAHQAWYTHLANSESGQAVGIAAFTGRRPDAATVLGDQDGLYTLLVRGREGDQAEIITSISAAYDGADVEALCRHLRDPAVTIVTLTVTEAGYRRSPDGGIDRDDPEVTADIAALRTSGGIPVTVPGRLVAALAGRRDADAGPVAIVPCDNLSDNGPATRRVVLDLAGAVDPDLRDWIDEQVGFVSTMVDRITPATTDADRDTVSGLIGLDDHTPVVTEPFAEWVVESGGLPDRRPAWETVGARIVDDVTPFELRKLWLLNGAHSLLAYDGLARGHRTVAVAMADPVCRDWIEQWWDTAGALLPLAADEVAAYRAALVDRFENPRIEHNLRQIAGDGSQKLPFRVVPVLERERAAGRLPAAAVQALAGWLIHLRTGEVRDPRADDLVPRVAGPLPEATRVVLGEVAPALVDDEKLVDAIVAAADGLRAD
ncbi:MAG TPA: mannitol dehydrogenase family protein [Mycobacteriales bacterium]